MNPLLPASEPTPSTDQGRWFVAEVHPHAPALKSWLRSRFPRLPDVEDIAQIAFLRLWRRQSQPGTAMPRSPKAVLFAIARNAAIDEVRHRVASRTDAVAETGQLHVLDEGSDVPATVSARQELEFLADALRGLPTRCRQVITLTKIYGLTEKQVAEKLGISENTVRTHVVRGMESCTEYLRRHGVNRK
ncbi:RNA polymerase sigma factor [Opitutus sp. GAS368]|uniref:RNA polymerase sigma factor n=1 Tax=Opitutus sp. GAS368 TaxID=1882749 RepID=UPI00087C93D6|nr:RNA polymerase sigma factor [Opitutus sp. GAS368]SDS37635.1 RNA polymerase sigma-70 factor, ECF subfamily [Opitutus sp. GAS368]